MNSEAKTVFSLVSPYKPYGDQPEAIKELYKNFKKGKNRQTLLGVTGSGKTFTMANVIQKLGKKTLIMAPNKTLAAQLFSEFKDFFPNNAVEYFVSYYDYYQPEAYNVTTDTYIEKDASINDEIDKLRHSATKNLLERDDVIVVSSVSCIYGIGSPDEYGEQRLKIFTGDRIGVKQLSEKLLALQYKRNDVDFFRGRFRVRGDIVEVFPAYEESQILRFEFFDDEIEYIKLQDPLTGRVIQSLESATLFPSSHYVVSKERMKSAMKNIRVELREHLQLLEKENKLVEYQRLEQRTLLDLEMMEELGFCSGIENYSRHLTGRNPGDSPPTLIDFFGDDFLMILDESHLMIPQIRGMYGGDRSRKQNLVEYGFRLPSAIDNRPLNFEEYAKKLDRTLYVSATPGDYELKQTGGEFVEQIIRPTGLLDPVIEIRDADQQVEDIVNESKKVIQSGGRIFVTTMTKRMAEDLSEFFKRSNLKARYLHSDVDTLERIEILRDLRLGEFDVLIGINLLREGIDCPEVKLVGILDADKEGFLRSERSLIQTIGRAARNSEGRVILYARSTTKSMEKAISETRRRREIQKEHNQKNGITPKTIEKNVSSGVIDILRRKKRKRNAPEPAAREQFATIDEIDLRISELTASKKEAIRDLEFEKAAELRDIIKRLTEMRLAL